MSNPQKAGKQRYELIEDLPGVGDATAAKLREAGFSTVESLAMATTRDLAEAGVGEDRAREIIQEARRSAAIAFVTAEELLKLRESVQRLSTGVRAFDGLLDGGLETQTITEFYGEFGVGKSVLCHQLCVGVQLPPERGGLEGGALYIDTERTFRPEWIVRMAKRFGLDSREALRRIVYAEAFNSDHQVLLLDTADEVMKENAIRLVVVDSLTAHFRSEYLGREMLAERQQKLNRHLNRLFRLARAFNAVAVVTNQVMAKPDTFFGDPTAPVGGHVLAHTSHTRLYIRKGRGETRIVRLVSSPYLPEGEVVGRLSGQGFEDVGEEG